MENKIMFFEVTNDTPSEMEIIHEPECWEFLLPVGESVIIKTDINPVDDILQLRISVENNQVGIRIMTNMADYVVYHKGEDVFKDYYD